jgi:hypothetical protein
MNRWPVLFVLVGLVGAGLAYDQAVDMPVAATETATDQRIISPSMTDPPRLDGAWYCPVGSSEIGGFADHQVNISNLSDEQAVANVSIVTEDGPGPGRRIVLAPKTTERVKLSETLSSELAGAVVEITGGRGAVGHTVTTAQGVAEGPCATNASNTWYFAAGRTTRDSTQYLALMNPFPETAVFDVEFQAVGRSREPGPLQGAFVEARSVRIIEVGDYVSREEDLATKITTNRGRLVVERLQVLDGELGPSGAALQLGVPTPAPSWIFTAGRIHENGEDLLTIFNPYESETAGLAAPGVDGEREGFLTVAVDLWPSNPTDLSSFSVVTIEREVRPGTFVTIDLRAQAERFEFPLPYELGVNVSSIEGLPIVAERWQFSQRLEADTLATGAGTATDSEEQAAADGEETADGEQPVEGEEPLELQPPEPVDSGLPQPIANRGIATSRGNELFSSRWVVPWVTMEGDSTLIAVASIDEAAVEVEILTGGDFTGPFRATVPMGGRAIIPVTSVEGGAAVQVVSDTPVSVEAIVVLPDRSLDVVPAVPTVQN